MMKLDGQYHPAEALDGELLDLLLDEAERALLLVEARADDPGRRIIDADAPEHTSEDVSELRLAIAELVDAYPSIPYDLELIGERVRNVGIHSGTQELESHPEVLDLVRMSLEVFFRQNPDLDLYEAEQRAALLAGAGDDHEAMDDSADAPGDAYARFGQLLGALRTRVS